MDHPPTVGAKAKDRQRVARCRCGKRGAFHSGPKSLDQTGTNAGAERGVHPVLFTTRTGGTADTLAQGGLLVRVTVSVPEYCTLPTSSRAAAQKLQTPRLRVLVVKLQLPLLSAVVLPR